VSRTRRESESPRMSTEKRTAALMRGRLRANGVAFPAEGRYPAAIGSA